MAAVDHTHPKPADGLQGIRKHWRSDFLAAVSVSLVALPLGLGVAVASGAPPVAGLTSAIIGGLVVTLFRGSHLAINGPAAGLIAVVLSAIYSLDDGSGQALNYVLAATCVSGALQVLLGKLKLGYIAEVIPSSVIQGIMVAIGVIIFTSQLYVAIGLSPERGNTIEQLLGFFSRISQGHPVIFLISLLGVLFLALTHKLHSKLLQFFPATLWVLVLSIPLVYLFGFQEGNSLNFLGNTYPLSPRYLIDLPEDLSQVILFPNFSKIHTPAFWVAVASITLIASIQTLAMAKAVDKLDPYKRKTDLNKDLVGVGMGTLAAGALGGLPVITVIVRSTVNVTNNAKTRWSNFYHGLLILLYLLVLAPVIQTVPLAALAAILLYIGFRLASPAVFRKVYDMGIEQLIFLVVTLLITLYSDLLWGILAGTLFTLLVHILLARLPVGDFFRAAVRADTVLFKRPDDTYELRVRGVANFLGIPKLNKLLAKVPEEAELRIDLSETRLVGMTFMEKLTERYRAHKDAGGRVIITGLNKHISSSPHNRALKIFLHPVAQKLSPRQQRLQQLAERESYAFNSHVDWNTSYLRHFQFFEIRPIERKANSLRGSFPGLDARWEIADVTFNEGAGYGAEVFHTTVMILHLPRVLPKFVMEKEGLFDKIFDRALAFSGYRDIDFELYPDFSRKILLMGEDEGSLREFFGPQLIRFFESRPVQHIESNGEALLIFNKLKPARTDETERLIEFSRELAERVVQEVS